MSLLGRMLALGYAISSRKALLGGFASQYGQDRWVTERMLPGKRGGFFLDIGAADGITLSNSYVLEKRFGWTGLCIEPNTRFFRRLRRNRRCICDPSCIGEPAVGAQFLEAGLFSGLGSARTPEHGSLLRRLSPGGERVITTDVTALSTLFARHNVPGVIDYVSLDTEGSELGILQTFPFHTHRFLAMTVEHNGNPERKSGIHDLLSSHGYIRVKEHHVDDYYCYPELVEGLPASP